MSPTSYPGTFGRFQTIKELSSGSFGRTFLVQDGECTHALKWLRHDAPEEGRPRMKNEIWALKQLDHIAIPAFVASGEHEGRPYYAMTLAPGKSLRKRYAIQKGWGSTSGEKWVLTIVEGILRALVHMQSRDILHRDVKDDNIMVDNDLKHITLVDFGFCRGAGQPIDVASFRNVGAYRYSPPDKLRHPSQVHITHDVFAIGVTAYLMLTNEYPWSVSEKEDAGHLEHSMRTSLPPDVDQINSLVSRDVAAFISSLLVIDDDHRPLPADAEVHAHEILERISSGRRLQKFSARKQGVFPRVVRDPIHGDIRMTDYEWQILGTPEFQRLRHIKQLGFANLVYPGAEHTRFSHSIGALFMADKIMQSIEVMGRTRVLPEERLAVRIFALVHDISHICFGHTIEDELGFYSRHDRNSDRFGRLLFSDQSKIGRILNDRDYGRAVLTIVREASSTWNDDASGRLTTVIEEIVEGPMGADVLDYIDRDSYFCGLDHRVDSAIFRRYQIGTIGRAQPDERHLISRLLGTHGLRLDAEFALESLLLERFALFLKVYTHPAKVAAGAMLGKALRDNSKSRGSKRLTEEKLEAMGDDALLRFLGESTRELSSDLAKRLLERRLFKLYFAHVPS